jgi:hypothetical protein
MRTGLLAILIAIATFAVLPVAKAATKEKTPPTNCSLSAEDYEVFSAVLSGLGQPEDPEESWAGKDILLSDVTAQQEFKDKQWGGWGFHSKSKTTPAKETQADAAAKAEDHCQVGPKLQASLSYQMISTEYLNKIFKKGGRNWEAFYKAYPKAAGYWDFSRPGYDSSHDEAMLYVGHYCGGLCGTGHLYFLKKENGHWEVLSKQMLWIS